MREPQTKQIGTSTYEVTPLPAGKGLALLTRLTKVLGPLLAAAPSLVAAVDAVAGEALGGVLEHITESDVEYLCSTLRSTSRVRPAGADWLSLDRCFDLQFQGDYLSLFDWLRFALEVNYGGFFDGLQSRVASAKAPPASPTVNAPNA